ncbi:hypothetical protein [Listeria booriae]|uniref:Uncharacterized protein n=1 Tax=Listeria booriae TaxID=1552123 RepID=A0A841XVE1_9LIST|nr:hypothetical protein [Listeria booriae]MBC1316623.1 hypothetical protein [Listeria booriae]
MTQSQNEKDRECVNRAIELCDIAGRGGLGKINNNPLVQTILLADRLLKERENAEVVYKLYDKKRAETHCYKNTSYLYNDEFKQEKGIWIPSEEDE